MGAKLKKLQKTLANREMVTIGTSLKSVLTKPLPIITSYTLTKNIDILNKELKAFDKERNKLIDKYGKRDDDNARVKDKKGGVIMAEPESFTKDLNELLDIENTLEVYVINFDDLGQTDFTPQELMALKFMITDF